MKSKPNKKLCLPWTPQREKASGNHQILLPRKKSYRLNFPHTLIMISLSGFVFPSVMYQFFDLADRAVVNDA